MPSTMTTPMAGMSIVNWINLKAKLEESAGTLRVLILIVFPLAIITSVLHVLSMHVHVFMPIMHITHVLHVILISITFLLLSIYLYLSTCIASERTYRELRIRMAVDKAAAYIQDIPIAAPVFNIFSGVLANKGIVTHAPSALRAVAFYDALYIDGNSPSRAGYAKTVSTLSKMGVTLSDSRIDDHIQIALGPYSSNKEADIVLTEDRITHTLFVVYVARLYVRYERLIHSLFLVACAVAICVAILGRYAYVFAAFAIWSGIYILLIRRAEIVTANPTFSMMESSKPLKSVKTGKRTKQKTQEE